jgi:hypothetical protein
MHSAVKDNPVYRQFAYHWSEFDEFHTVCGYGYIHIAKWMYDRRAHAGSNIDLTLAIENACKNGHLEIVIWLPKIPVCYYGPFYLACENGHLDVAKWLYTFEIKDTKQLFTFRIEDWMVRFAFSKSCVCGQLDVAKWLLERGVNIHLQGRDGFVAACQHGQLNIITWLYDLGVRVGPRLMFAIRHTCEEKHEEIMQWLRNHEIDPRVDYNFNCAIYSEGNYGAIKWARSLGSKAPSYSWIFVEACKNGHFTLVREAQRLECFSIDMRTTGFKLACENGHLGMAKWMCRLGVNMSLDIPLTFLKTCAKGYFETAKWLNGIIYIPTDIIDLAIDVSLKIENCQFAAWLQSLKVNHR